MNFRITTLILIFWAFSTTVIFAQESSSCKVLMTQISGTYKGKCKKGLANGNGEARGIDHYIGHFSKGWPDGKGTYTWANGDIYEGEFVKGMREGIGTMTLHEIKKDSIISGVWEKDRYAGPIPEKPKIIMKYNLDKYNFQYVSNIRNRVLIKFWQNGINNTTIENLSIVSSTGSNVQRGQMYGVDFVNFPAKIRVNYTTWNSLHTQQYNVLFEFEISQPGDWVVTMYN